MTTQGADTRQLAGLGPASHSLGVDPKKGRHFTGCHQVLGFRDWTHARNLGTAV